MTTTEAVVPARSLMLSGTLSMRTITGMRCASRIHSKVGLTPMTVSQIALSNRPCVDRKRYKERKDQREEYSADKPGYSRVYPIAQCPLAL